MRHKALLFSVALLCDVTGARADIPVQDTRARDDGKKHFRLHDEGAGL